MNVLKRNFTALIAALVFVMVALAVLSMVLANNAGAAEDQDFPVPVSVNALMVSY